MPEDRYFTPRGRLLQFITWAHRAMYRASRGRLGASARGKPTLLLTTTGRKTGQRRTVPLPFLPDGDRMVVIASFAGSPTHPAWYLNLAAHPDVTVQYRDRTLAATATTAEGDHRDELWARITADKPRYEDYQRQTSRQRPVVVLSPA